jgi:hypothetical protein
MPTEISAILGVFQAIIFFLIQYWWADLAGAAFVPIAKVSIAFVYPIYT